MVEAGSVRGPCKSDSDCPDDGVPCTKEVCAEDGFCDRVAQDLPVGDKGCDDPNPCTEDVCQQGACAHLPRDVFVSDSNPCTTDACVDGVATYTEVPDGTPCGLNDALQCVGGKCNCTSAEECGQSTECLKFECAGQCSSTTLEKGTLVDSLNPGDCLKRVCDGANAVVTVPDVTDAPADAATGNCIKKGCDDKGSVVDEPDPTDVPGDDSNPCTTEGCNGGVPLDHVPVSDGTPCGNGPMCGAVPGGGYQTSPHDTCVGGACTSQPASSCGLFVCDASGTACLVSCAGGGDCIAVAYCDNGSNLCTPLAGIGAACANQAQCAMGTFCVDGVCCNNACTDTCRRCNDPGSEGLCVPVASGQDPDGECPGQDACNGLGGCAKPNGALCGSPLDCLSGFCEDGVCCGTSCPGACTSCNLPNSVGTCAPLDASAQPAGCSGTKACNGAGSCLALNGQSCAGNNECLSGFCGDGVCCNNACAGTCARCDLPGNVGTCTNVPVGQQVSGCNTTMACDGNNACKKASGQACGAAGECVTGFCPSEGATQKYCCDTGCLGACQSCSGAKTTLGVNGICSMIKTNTDPDNECAGQCMGNGVGCCDGTGACL